MTSSSTAATVSDNSKCNTGQIMNPSISICPSDKLVKYLKNIRNVSTDVPEGIKSIIFKNKTNSKRNLENDKANNKLNQTKVDYLMTDKDREFLKKFNLDKFSENLNKNTTKDCSSGNNSKELLKLEDLHWLYNYLQCENANNMDKVYLHDLLEGCSVILPKNIEIPRNEELEKRCKLLKAQQENRDYRSMTKNVDNTRKRLPEDTIGYQIKQMNRHLIAIFQFIISVAAGFAFGFIGVELLIGSLDFGFRLLLGIICALTIALAELYFLAKKLNEDINMEYSMYQQDKNVKID